MTEPPGLNRIGIDLGGTKIEGVLLGSGGVELARHRSPAPRNDYGATLEAIRTMVERLEAAGPAARGIGVGMPGSLAPRTGRVQNANSTWLNGRPLRSDLEHALARPVRLANDANCFALSEASDGAGAGARSVFGVILGTGCGGAFVRDGALNDGPNGIGGEWGHNPLPWPDADEYPGRTCWCLRSGCLETWVSGPGLAADYRAATGLAAEAPEIADRARRGDLPSRAALDRHANRLARGLSHVVNILDPEVIVLGGGISQLAHLYAELPELMKRYIFSDDPQVAVRPPVHGDASGVRGAARLWPEGH